MYLSIGMWVIIISCMFYILFIFGRVNYRTNQRTVSKVGDVDTEVTSDGDDNDNPATTSPSSNASSPTNWGGIVVGLVIAVLTIGVFAWSPWEKGEGKNDREVLLQTSPVTNNYGGQYVTIFIPRKFRDGKSCLYFQGWLADKKVIGTTPKEIRNGPSSSMCPRKGVDLVGYVLVPGRFQEGDILQARISPRD